MDRKVRSRRIISREQRIMESHPVRSAAIKGACAAALLHGSALFESARHITSSGADAYDLINIAATPAYLAGFSALLGLEGIVKKAMHKDGLDFTAVSKGIKPADRRISIDSESAFSWISEQIWRNRRLISYAGAAAVLAATANFPGLWHNLSSAFGGAESAGAGSLSSGYDMLSGLAGLAAYPLLAKKSLDVIIGSLFSRELREVIRSYRLHGSMGDEDIAGISSRMKGTAAWPKLVLAEGYIKKGEIGVGCELFRQALASGKAGDEEMLYDNKSLAYVRYMIEHLDFRRQRRRYSQGEISLEAYANSVFRKALRYKVLGKPELAEQAIDQLVAEAEKEKNFNMIFTSALVMAGTGAGNEKIESVCSRGYSMIEAKVMNATRKIEVPCQGNVRVFSEDTIEAAGFMTKGFVLEMYRSYHEAVRSAEIAGLMLKRGGYHAKARPLAVVKTRDDEYPFVLISVRAPGVFPTEFLKRHPEQGERLSDLMMRHVVFFDNTYRKDINGRVIDREAVRMRSPYIDDSLLMYKRINGILFLNLLKAGVNVKRSIRADILGGAKYLQQQMITPGWEVADMDFQYRNMLVDIALFEEKGELELYKIDFKNTRSIPAFMEFLKPYLTINPRIGAEQRMDIDAERFIGYYNGKNNRDIRAELGASVDASLLANVAGNCMLLYGFEAKNAMMIQALRESGIERFGVEIESTGPEVFEYFFNMACWGFDELIGSGLLDRQYAEKIAKMQDAWLRMEGSHEGVFGR